MIHDPSACVACASLVVGGALSVIYLVLVARELLKSLH